jgi:hypothetical protein
MSPTTPVASLHQLQFPLGEFTFSSQANRVQLDRWISDIANFPNALRESTRNLTALQKNWQYRPQGWTIKQVVHHCADSHMNSLIRFKRTLTEEQPTIRPYYEDRWALLVDGQDDHIEASLLLLAGLHYKWACLLRALSNSDLGRSFLHPKQGKAITIKEAIAFYAWHGRHHLAHIQQALAAKGVYNS